jgi:hypothetical protein
MDSGKSDPNPFSFKAFLKRGEGPAPPPTATAASSTKRSGVKKKAKGSARKEPGESLPSLVDDGLGTLGVVRAWQGFQNDLGQTSTCSTSGWHSHATS